MKKSLIVIIYVIALVVISVLMYMSLKSITPACGTPFYVRDVVTNQCEIKVGCSLPVGIKEDFSCRVNFIPEVNGTLNSQVILFKNQTLNIVEEGLKIKLIGLSNSSCPKNAQCIWSGIEIFYRVYKNNETTAAIATYPHEAPIDVFGYKINTYETDYESYAKIEITKK